MKALRAVAGTLALITAANVAFAQHIKPAGVVETRRTVNARHFPSHTGLPHAMPADSGHGHPWRWVGTGAVLGAVAGGLAAGVSISRTDDAMLAGPAIIVSTGAGAVVGGLVGGLSYAMSRAASQSRRGDASRTSSDSFPNAHRQRRE